MIMGYMIEITEDKFEELTEGVKVMSCLDGMKRERMGNRMPMPDYRDRWHDDDWRDEDRYGERRYYGRHGGRY